MTDMNLSLIIRLIDQFSQPAKALRNGVQQVVNDMRRGFSDAIVEGFSAENMDRAIAQAENQLSRAKGRLMGALGMATSLAAPVVNLGKFESQLVAFGNTAGIFGSDLAEVESQLRDIGPKVNKSASEMLVALEYLVGKGLSPEAGLAAIRAVGMTATGTGADIEDMAASGFSVLDNLKVPAEQLQLAFDAMAQSGKAGGFELRGMAQYFPQLTASARALKMEGVPAVAELGAALQIAMKGAGSESEAANNMQNFLSKLSSPETVKRFKDMGVDLQAEFEKASDNGVSVFEHMLGLIDELTAGDQFKMGELFGDQQVLAFLRPMIANLDEFKTIRDQALSADGINAADFGRVMDTLAERTKAAVIQLDNMSTSGAVLLEIAKDIASQVGLWLGHVNSFAEANPELTRTVVMVAAGMMALSIASRVAAFSLLGARLATLGLLNNFLRFDAAGRNTAAGWRMLAGAGRGLGSAMMFLVGLVPALRNAVVGFSMLSAVGGFLPAAFSVIGTAAGAVVGALGAISAPIWGVVAVVAAAGFAIWKFWDRISSFVSGVASGLGGLLGPAVGAVGEAINGLIGKLGELLGIDPAQMEAFRASIAEGFAAAFNVGPLLDGAKQMFGDFWTWLGGFFTQETLSDAEKGQMHEAGKRLITDMWEGIKAKFAEVLEWFATLPGQIGAAIGSIDIGALIQWPEPPDWLSWLFGGAPPPNDGPDIPPVAPSGGGDWWNPMSWGQKPEVQATIAAEVVDKRPPQVTVQVTAPISISGVSDPRAAANAASAGLAAAVSQAQAGALHDGMD